MRVRAGLVAMLVSVTSCGGPPATVSAAPATTTTAIATTMPASLEVTVTGCSAPPVTFGLLCEVVELVAANHFDPPTDLDLASGAIDGVRLFRSEDFEPLPRALTCAVPTAAFAPLCDVVADRMEVHQFPLAPMIESAVSNMLASTVDPYTMYIPPELSGAIGEDGIIAGLGIVVGALTVAGSPCVRIETSCPLQVITVLASGQAEAAGLRAGDLIDSVDDADVVGRTVIEVAGMMAGEPGTEVDLGIRREEVPQRVTVIRADAEALPISAEMVGNTGYLRLPEFGIDAHLFFHYALEGLIEAGARRLVLDLRDNPGGFLFSVSIIGSEFFSSGLLYRTQSPTENLDFPAVDGGIATRLPVITIVNESSASAAEILAAVLKERGRSVIVGTPTYGKHLVQVPFDLHNGGMLRVSISRWVTPDGASVEGIGVTPNITLDLAPDLAVPELVEAVVAAAG